MLGNIFTKQLQASLEKAWISIRHITEKQFALLVFFVGTSLYIYAHIALITQPLQLRKVPIEADDAYSYIHKARQFEDCFFQECRAMTDLKAQLLSPTNEEDIAAQRFRQAHRIINQYHPLHSFILLGLKIIGIPLENGYNLLSFSGAILLPAMLAYWLSRLWGFGPAGIGIALISFHNFLGQGTYFIVPSNLALMIALFVFASILNKRERSSPIVLIGILLMIAMHNIGQLYSLMAIALFFLCTKERFSKQSLTTLLIASVFLLSTFILPELITSPETNLSAYDFVTEEINYREEVQTNFASLKDLFTFWANTYESPNLILILVSIGFIFAVYRHKWNVFIMGGLLGALLFVALFFAIPWYPAVAVDRLWLPFAIILAGSLGQCFWFWIKGLYYIWSELKIVRLADILNDQRTWFVLSLTVFSLMFVYNLFSSANAHRNKHFTSLENYMLHNKDLFFDTYQRDHILDHSTPHDTILYTSETALYYYLSQESFYNLGAVFFPAVIGSSEQDTWLKNNQSIRFIVGGSELNKIESVSQGRIVLAPGDRLVVQSDTLIDLSTVRFSFTTPPRTTLIKIHYVLDGEKETQTIELTNDLKSWLSLGLDETTLVQEFTFLVNSGFVLEGIQLEPTSTNLHWPWNQGIEMRYIPKPDEFRNPQPSSARFSTEKFEVILGRTINIVSDTGSNILLEVSK